MSNGRAGRRPVTVAALAAILGCLASAAPSHAALPDGRAWEMVSPVDKNGGKIASPAEAGPGAFGAAAQGGAVAFASAASFAGAQGAAPFSQYVARRTAGGWLTENITPAHLSGAYDGAPFVDFSADLARSLYLNPARCPEGEPCPDGYQLRDNLTGALTASPQGLGLLFEGASDDLGDVVFSAGGDLHLWSPPASGLTVVNDSSGAELAGRERAVSTGAARIYWTDLATGDLRLRDGAQTKQVDTAAGGDGTFETATADGAVAFFSKEGHLWSYDAVADAATDLTPSGGVIATLGASADGSRVFYATATGLWRWRSGFGATPILSSAQLTDVAAESAGVTAGGSRLLFTTDAALALVDTNNDADVYQWEAQGAGSCVQAGGCLALISSGRSEHGATLVGASADGADVFFVTDGSLVPADPGSVDLYDARVGGGFAEPPTPIACEGDACHSLPPEPVDPALSTLAVGPGNPPVRYQRYRRRARKRCRMGHWAGRPSKKARRAACRKRRRRR